MLDSPAAHPIDVGKLAARQTDPVTFIPDESLTVGPTPTAESQSPSAGTSSASTSDSPLFPYPTQDADDCGDCGADNNSYAKRVVEGALIVAAVALILAVVFWRAIRLRRRDRPLRQFFRPPSRSGVHRSVSRPSTVPRTTGLPPTHGPPPSVICDYSLATPVPLLHRGDVGLQGHRRGRGRRTHAGDIDGRGRRGPVTHPDDPNEFLPEYDDKDVLPRYQDIEAGMAAGRDNVVGVVGAGAADAPDRVEDAGRMAGVGAALGRSPNGDAGHSHTDLLVAGERRSVLPSEDEHVYPPPPSSAESHEGHGHVQRHD
ncbi:hypothetical protein C8Q77DRAFT_1158248 [Trametes polyzona]|nr:hypothetical protein C8Q77DRAFT_1158248 [Trametes polyzona]